MSKELMYRLASSAAQVDSFVIPPRYALQAAVSNMEYVGGTAADAISFVLGNGLYVTKVNTAAAAAATALVLVGDAAVKNKINGRTVAANDICIVATAAGWQAFIVASVNGSAADGTVGIATMTEYDGVTGLIGAVAAGQPAFIIPSTDAVYTKTIGTADGRIELGPIAVADPDLPLLILFDSKGASAHEAWGVACYEPVGAFYR